MAMAMGSRQRRSPPAKKRLSSGSKGTYSGGGGGGYYYEGGGGGYGGGGGGISGGRSPRTPSSGSGAASSPQHTPSPRRVVRMSRCYACDLADGDDFCAACGRGGATPSPRLPGTRSPYSPGGALAKY